MWNCKLCRVSFQCESIEQHLYTNHLKPIAGNWKNFNCGECMFTGGNLEEIFIHCIQLLHDPSKVSRGVQFNEYSIRMLSALEDLMETSSCRQQCKNSGNGTCPSSSSGHNIQPNSIHSSNNNSNKCIGTKVNEDIMNDNTNRISWTENYRAIDPTTATNNDNNNNNNNSKDNNDNSSSTFLMNNVSLNSNSFDLSTLNHPHRYAASSNENDHLLSQLQHKSSNDENSERSSARLNEGEGGPVVRKIEPPPTLTSSSSSPTHYVSDDFNTGGVDSVVSSDYYYTGGTASSAGHDQHQFDNECRPSTNQQLRSPPSRKKAKQTENDDGIEDANAMMMTKLQSIFNGSEKLPPIRCTPDCGESFRSPAALERHKRKFHRNIDGDQGGQKQFEKSSDSLTNTDRSTRRKPGRKTGAESRSGLWSLVRQDEKRLLCLVNGCNKQWPLKKDALSLIHSHAVRRHRDLNLYNLAVDERLDTLPFGTLNYYCS